MSEVSNKKSFYIDFAIIILLMIGFGFLPPVGPLTQVGMQTLGIFISLIYAWSRGQMIWTSLLGLIVYGYVGENTVAGIFTAAFGNGTLLMVVWITVFAAAVERCGLLQFVAEWVLTKKFVTKSPMMMALGFFIASVLAGIFVGNPAASIFLWAIFYDVVGKLGVPKKSPYVTAVLVGIVVLTYTGNAILPYYVFLQIGLGIMAAADPSFTLNLGSFSLLSIVINIVLVPALLLVTKLLCRNVNFKIDENIINKKGNKLNREQKIVFVTLICVVALLIVPNFLPVSSIKTFLLNFGTVGAMCLGAVVLMVITVNGQSINDIGESMKTALPWSTYFMLAAALAISNGITADGTGVVELLSNVFGPVLGGKSMFVFMAILIVIGVVLTNIMNNIVTYTLLIPLSLPFAATCGVPEQLIVALLAIILCQGVVMPSGSVMGALLHANKDWLTTSMIYKYAICFELTLAIITIIVGVPVGSWLF
ncbi:MAG: SLC13 family permease [Peptococcaceae bacterium]|nr:SLC13 family permease [Peptococcaceae bacterium]